MPTHLTPREPTKAALLIQCGRYITGITVLLVALILFKLRSSGHLTPRRGSESASAAARPYFLDEIRALSVTVTGCQTLGTNRGSAPHFFGFSLLM